MDSVSTRCGKDFASFREEIAIKKHFIIAHPILVEFVYYLTPVGRCLEGVGPYDGWVYFSAG